MAQATPGQVTLGSSPPPGATTDALHPERSIDVKGTAKPNRKSGRLLGAVPVLLSVSLLVAACGTSDGTSDVADAGEPQHGGTVTALLEQSFAGGWPTGLDPATNTTGGANLPQMHAIFGGLFLLEADDDGSNGRIVPNQAESYEISEDGLTLTITLRDGIEFTDGTPLDAEAVAWNFVRNTTAPCTCAPQWQLAGSAEAGEDFDPADAITVVDPLTVQVEFETPNAAIVNSFPVSNINWIASPTSYEEMGEEQFQVTPVGAGPFTVVDNQFSSRLVLERNENYFKEDLPYLDGLTFQSIGGDQPALQALQAGQAQAYEGMSTSPLIEEAQATDGLVTTVQPPTSPYVIQLNTRIPPFDDTRAREAIYYATDFDAIAEGVFGGQFPVSQSFTAEGGLFHAPDVEGYLGYDPDRAQEIVDELGGLSVHLGTISIHTATTVLTALETQWREAGIDVTTDNYQLSTLIEEFLGGEWQAMLQTAGAWDPAAGVGVGFRFSSTAPFSGVGDEELDALLNAGVATLDPDERFAIYQEAGELIAREAYAPFGLAFAPANIAAEGVYGPGLTTRIPAIAVNSGVLWERVWMVQE
jgi:peptide/nickel transport system substrate-binding protein